MDPQIILQASTLVVVLLTGGVLPFILTSQREARKARAVRFNRIDDSLIHLDQCLDNLRQQVAGNLITRLEFTQYRAESAEAFSTHQASVAEILTRMRAAIAADTNGLHERLMRIENAHMDRPHA